VKLNPKNNCPIKKQTESKKIANKKYAFDFFRVIKVYTNINISKNPFNMALYGVYPSPLNLDILDIPSET
jgi:hypothetical protein